MPLSGPVDPSLLRRYPGTPTPGGMPWYAKSQAAAITEKYVGQPRANVMCVGDSRTAGLLSGGGTTTTPYPTGVEILRPNNLIWNDGVSGSTLANMQTAWPANNASQRSHFRNNTAVVMGGINDTAGGATAAATYAALKALCAAINATGVNVVVCTDLPGSFAFEATHLAYNALIVADHSFAQGFIDVAANPAFVTTNTTIYGGDGTHLTQTGYTLLASVISAGLTAYFGDTGATITQVKNSMRVNNQDTASASVAYTTAGDFTVCGWCYPVSPTAFHVLFTLDNGGSSNHAIGIGASTNLISYFFASTARLNVTFGPNAWIWVALTVIGTTATFYAWSMGSTLIVSGTFTITAFTPTTIRIGRFTGSTSGWGGRMSQIRFFQRGLTQEQLVQELDSQVPVAPNCYANWTLGSATDFSDSTGNAHTLTSGGGTFTTEGGSPLVDPTVRPPRVSPDTSPLLVV